MVAKLPLSGLDLRHPGVTKAIGDGYCEAAAVCFDRHHSPPIDVEIQSPNSTASCSAEWNLPDDRTKRAWGNETDATRDAAYGVSLAAVELTEGYVAIGRAETRTGADYYLAPTDKVVSDFEDCLRLEVSGVDAGDPTTIAQRVKAKLKQLANGSKNTPGLAAVVGFRERIVAIQKQDPK